MIASELVKILQQKIELDGDLEIRIPRNPTTYIEEDADAVTIKIMGINTWLDENDRATGFMIMDEGWAEALT